MKEKIKGNGKFIVFEGLDGSGQTTQAKMLVDYLEKKKKRVLLTKEPTDNIIGGLIRGALKKNWHPSNECLQLLFSADRAFHLQNEILPALRKGFFVISDRYLFSTIAFGGIDCNIQWLESLNKNFLLPNIIFLLKVSPEECIRRLKKSRFGLELFEEKEKMQKVWKNYEKLTKKYKNIMMIDGMQKKEKVFEDVKEKLKKLKIIES